MSRDKTIELENALNELISEATENGGHVYIVDKKQNTFALKLNAPVKIQFYAGYESISNQSREVEK
jgi:hypothetical protein